MSRIEAQPEHEGEHVRRRVRDGVEVVDVLGGLAADVDLGAAAGEDGRDHVRAQVAHRRTAAAADGVAADRDGEERDRSRPTMLDGARAEARIGGELVLEPREIAARADGAAADGDDRAPARALRGELALEERGSPASRAGCSAAW